MKIFIVEDDKWYNDLLTHHLSLNPDHEVESFLTGKELFQNLYKKPSVITLDYSLPDMSGKEILKKLKVQLPDVPVVIISGQEDVATAVSLLKEGAYDYIVKDEDAKERLWNVLSHLQDNQKLKEEVIHLKQEIQQKYEFEKAIKGKSQAIKKIFALMEKAANTNITVSVSGETGTGKELVAKAIHYNSDKRKQPFVAVNVSAIPKELIESEMFGHEKGAFTGANTRRIGRFEEANNGTIFLDEIGDMDTNMQVKILRVLQEMELTRVGGNTKVKLNVRVITATHKDLLQEVQLGNFREDLYYRLMGLPIEIPPLRERGDDVLILAKFFIDEFCKDNKIPKLKIESSAIEKLKKYPFPGNVRELKAVIELAAVLTNSDSINADEISFRSSLNVNDFLLEEITLREYTNKIIMYFLQKYDNNVMLVADKLDIGKSTIYRMLKEIEVETNN